MARISLEQEMSDAELAKLLQEARAQQKKDWPAALESGNWGFTETTPEGQMAKDEARSGNKIAE